MLSIEYQAAISDAAERPVAMVWMGSAPEVQTIARRMAEIGALLQSRCLRVFLRTPS